MGDLITSIVRTIIPTIVGAIASFLATNDVQLNAEEVAALSTTLTALFGGAYYIVARIVETRWPQFGWLLGSPKKPEY